MLIPYELLVLCPAVCLVVLIYIEQHIVVLSQCTHNGTILLVHTGSFQGRILKLGDGFQMDGRRLRVLTELLLEVPHVLLDVAWQLREFIEK